ncbi:uncharacterized protein GLRG_03506 [Colletotrichum graminicola M1.001]|uniref:Uncharacterized protein n=1 Tax=Colletotrichum graminicola (strain M1.001 / M2 / FGSC 10212) TaxID=645133 RepID=E3QBM3_COLGM|nr:uncharacterized protein GLRG_03506 [Colletotrichum graminicola M1.001]EFQ28362.1 hypothetical protein GLRG_03506 [Colletotrichum graminicola M1.001]
MTTLTTLPQVIICRPGIPMVEHPANGPSDVPYDVVRKKHLFTPHELQKFIEQEESDKFGGDWEKVPTPRTMALTQRDFKEKDGLPPSGWPQESPGNHQLPTVQELWRVDPRMISNNK